MGNDQEICLRQHETGDRKAYTMEPYRKKDGNRGGRR